jgi:thiamine-phosphate pyrophosphorylase
MAQAHTTSRWTRQLHGLYAVTPDIVEIATLVAKVEAAIAGGAQAIQYRNKAAPRSLRRKQAAMLARVCGGGGALLIVNDDVELAREVGAAGVHLGEDDGDISRARENLGSFFPSPTKPGARRAEPALLHRAKTLRVPVVAIGGITAANGRALVAAGADALAVISAVFDHDKLADITRAAAAIVACFDTDHSAAKK